MKKQLILLFLALSMLGQNASALSLNDARAQGRVGETLSGYIAPLREDAETQALVKHINQARSESYQRLADANNLPMDEVAKMAGQKLVERARPGEYVQGINGKWLQK